MRFVRCNMAVVAAALLVGCVTPAPHKATAPVLPEGAPASDQFMEVGGAWLRVRDVGPTGGKRRPVVLVHGYASRLESWALIQPSLARRRRVVSYDQRGFGKSERTAGDYGPAAHARDLASVVDALGLKKPILVGHSYGGGVVLRAALDHPEKFGGLVLVDAFALEEQLPPVFKWARVPVLGEFIFATQFKEAVGEKYILAFRDRQRFSSPDAINEFRSNMMQPGALYASLRTVRGMDYRPDQTRYRNITLPTVIVWGEDDRVTPLAQGKLLAGAIDGARFEVLSQCGHVPPWERPEALVMHIEGLLARIERGHAPVPSVKGTGSATP